MRYNSHSIGLPATTGLPLGHHMSHLNIPLTLATHQPNMHYPMTPSIRPSFMNQTALICDLEQISGSQVEEARKYKRQRANSLDEFRKGILDKEDDDELLVQMVPEE